MSLYLRLRPTVAPVPAGVPQTLWPVMVPGYASGGTCSSNTPAARATAPVRQWWRRTPAASPAPPAAPLPKAPWQEVVAAAAPVAPVTAPAAEPDLRGLLSGRAPAALTIEPVEYRGAQAEAPPEDPPWRAAAPSESGALGPVYGAVGARGYSEDPRGSAVGAVPETTGAAESTRCAGGTADDACASEAMALAVPADTPMVVRGVERPRPQPGPAGPVAQPPAAPHPPVAPAATWRWAPAPLPAPVEAPAAQAPAAAVPSPDWLTSLGWPLAPAPTAAPATPATAPAAAATPAPLPSDPVTPEATPETKGSMRRWWRAERAEAAAALRAAFRGRGIAAVLGRLVRRRVVLTLPWRRHTGIVIRVSHEFVTLAMSGRKMAFIRVTSILAVEVR